MRYWWHFYYFWVRPTNMSEIVFAYCRKNGKPYKNLKLSKVDEDDLNL